MQCTDDNSSSSSSNDSADESECIKTSTPLITKANRLLTALKVLCGIFCLYDIRLLPSGPSSVDWRYITLRSLAMK